MNMETSCAESACQPLNICRIENRLKACPNLPSLKSIGTALKELLSADQRYTSQIAEIIRRDPSLTSRLLRIVNAAYYALSRQVKNVEDAVCFLGTRQVHHLVMVTPIIEDLQKLAGNRQFCWRGFWQHCIATAFMTTEVIDILETPKEEVDYVAGLLHDVGKIVMASTFPEHFNQIYRRRAGSQMDLLALERQVLGIDHAELGAAYIKRQALPEVFLESIRFHHRPEAAEYHRKTVAAVQVADLLVRYAAIGDSGNCAEVTEESWMESTGWKMLFAYQTPEEKAIARASLKRSLARIPNMLNGLV